MTRSELSKLKSDFIERRQEITKGNMTNLEKRLYNAIFDKLISELSTSDGIIDSTGQNIKLTAALDKIFKEFNENDYKRNINQFASDLLRITSLNKQYFQAAIEDYDPNKFNTITNQVDSFMNKRIGVKKDGTIEKKSYLDRLIKDETLKNKIKDSLMKAITNKKPIKDFIKDTEVLIKGNEYVEGALVKNYNTYIRDTYSQFDRTNGKLYAEKLGLQCFIYQGGKIKTSRKFCIKHDGKVYTTEEAQDWGKNIGKTDDAPIFDKDTYNPLVDCGGYNCRHSIDYISNSLAKRLRPDLKDKL